MIDAIDLLLVGNLQYLLVERFCRFQVVAEWLFDNDPAPVIVVLLQQSIGGELLHNGTEKIRSGRQVVEEILVCIMVAVYLGEVIFNLWIKFVILKIAGEIVEAPRKALPQRVVDAVAAIFLNIVADLFAKILVAFLRASHTQYCKFLGEPVRPG